MQRTVLFIVIALIAFSGAQAQDDELEFLYRFLKGSYEIIGRRPDSNDTYTGKVVLRKTDGHLRVTRYINSQEIEGTGKIETTTCDKVKVLRVSFIEKGQAYEVTYLINSDLDNYGRLTGYVYQKEGKTKQVGLEALFIDRQALRK